MNEPVSPISSARIPNLDANSGEIKFAFAPESKNTTAVWSPTFPQALNSSEASSFAMSPNQPWRGFLFSYRLDFFRRIFFLLLSMRAPFATMSHLFANKALVVGHKFFAFFRRTIRIWSPILFLFFSLEFTTKFLYFVVFVLSGSLSVLESGYLSEKHVVSGLCDLDHLCHILYLVLDAIVA